MAFTKEEEGPSAAPSGGAGKQKLERWSLGSLVDGSKSLLIFVVLALAWFLGFSSRLFSVLRFESIIHEFDPWFNYRATAQLTEHGFYHFLNWFDETAWYPLGRIVGGTVYPGLMVTSGLIHYVLNTLNITVHIRDVCVFLAPIFSGLTAIATYLLTKEVWNRGAGLLAACFIAIVPGYISRSVAGSYDNEGIAIFALMCTYWLWVKSVKTGSVFWAVACSISYFYMVSAWGGYVFIINLIPLHVFFLLLMGRFSNRVYVVYTTFFILGLVLSMQVPFVGFQPLRTSEHMAAIGVFLLLQAVAFLTFLRSHLPLAAFKQLFLLLAVAAAAVVFLGVVALTYLGYVAPWSGRFYSLYDTNYAKIHIPIISSVAEHQPTTWLAFFRDLHILVIAFPAGVWLCFRKLSDECVFVLIYAVTASYFSGVMVRLILTLTPIVCVMAAIAMSSVLEKQMGSKVLELDSIYTHTTTSDAYNILTEDKSTKASAKAGRRKQQKERQQKEPEPEPEAEEKTTTSTSSAPEKQAKRGNVVFRYGVVALLCVFLGMFAVHCTWTTSYMYSGPSVILESSNSDGSRRILDDFREGYFWLRQNTHPQARIMSWWDYGYQIAGFANRTTLVDNNTWNNSHIAMVGKAMSSNESAAYEIMRSLDVDYVLVIFGGQIGYSGDDINKFLWMVRIAEGEHPKEIREPDYFADGQFRVDSGGSKTLLNCLMYKLCYYRFGEVQHGWNSPRGYDHTRNVEIGHKDFELTHLEEAFTSEHWLVRIYKVKDLVNREKSGLSARKTNRKNLPRVKRVKTSGRPRGNVKDKLSLKKGKAVKKRTGGSAKKATKAKKK
ncbi:dolichyl-diphosphooligosaccharide--protein glycosyltransferase subunit STT3B-like [Sycon ciliatum]|uniref:dolichyl-diphosphooligosaccharide--protein glycosyltransferase subunit STT3B-like n=1 Tax=Sycon ciliatum TaxID=27933 RepID=UPI0031F71357